FLFHYIEIEASVDSYMEIPIAVDERFDVYVNDKQYTTLFTMPSGIEYTVIGSLVRDGLIGSIDDIEDIDIDLKRKRIYVRLAKDVEVNKIYIEDCSILVKQGVYVSSNFTIDWKNLVEIFSDFNAKTTSVTMGIASHTSGLYDLESGKAIIAHDSSRHSSILKIIGAGIKHTLNLDRSVAITTGRASSDMVVALARPGIPIAVSMRGPLYSGVAAAIILGVTLVVNLRRGEKIRGLIPLTHVKRIRGYPRELHTASPRSFGTI
ncbi:MAG: formate dehydrogenase accessory sulfurtransferase FdhD, partial [Sulfolobales archaeon]